MPLDVNLTQFSDETVTKTVHELGPDQDEVLLRPPGVMYYIFCELPRIRSLRLSMSAEMYFEYRHLLTKKMDGLSFL